MKNWKAIRSKIRQGLYLCGATALAAVGMGSSCPGTSSTANFENPVMFSVRPQPLPLRDWTAAIVVDRGAVDFGDNSRQFDTNMAVAGGPSNFPGAIFHDYATNFYLLFSSGTVAPPTVGAPGDILMYATNAPDISSSVWVESDGSFTRLDGAVAPATTRSTGSYKPMVDVDGLGHSMAVFLAEDPDSADKIRPLASRHFLGNGRAWDAPVDISSPTEASNAGQSLAIGHDALNNTVVAWVQGGKAYYNEYRPTLGWRYDASNPHVEWADITSANLPADTFVVDRGVDLGFDRYGNGYGLYVMQYTDTRQALLSTRWRRDTPRHFPDAGVVANIQRIHDAPVLPSVVNGGMGWPRVMALPDGSAYAFWYQNYNNGSLAELWWSSVAAPSPPGHPAQLDWSSPQRLDSRDTGSTQVYVAPSNAGPFMPPVIAHKGGFKAVAYIKSIGGVRRAVVLYDRGRGFEYIGYADVGGTGRDVEWVDIAVNAKGELIVVYSAVDPLDMSEHVYGNAYVYNSWQGVTQLDVSPYLRATARPARTMPKVSVDDQGNAAVTYNMADSFSGPARRRTVVNFYR